MTTILAIDPGTTHSAWVVLRDGVPDAFDITVNDVLCDMLLPGEYPSFRTCHHLAIEMIASYGMPVGKDVFETCVWIGRFVQAWGRGHSYVYRSDVKQHLCKSQRAKDSHIRQALIDLYGGGDAIGRKDDPGPLYGISKDVWSALAVGVTWREQCLNSSA